MLDRRSEVLMRSENPNQAFKALFALKKAEDPSFSFTRLMKEGGFLSKGHLSQLMSGKKPLVKRHLAALEAAFALNENQRAYLALLIDIERETDTIELERLRSERMVMEKLLRMKTTDSVGPGRKPFFEVDVFSAISLFRTPPSFADLLKIFGEENHALLAASLAFLVTDGVLACADGRYRRLCPVTTFGLEGARFEYLNFLQNSLGTLRDLCRDKKNMDAIAMQTFTVSVKMSEYQKLIPRIHKVIGDMVLELETPDADTLVRFNTQVFPVYTVKE